MNSNSPDHAKRHPLWKSFAFAGRGLAFHFRRERNARIQLAAALAVIAVGRFCRFERWEWCAVTVAVGLVMAAEAFNTSIELLVDLVHPHHDVRAGKVKDVSAGAVLISALAAVAVALFILVPRILATIMT